MTTRETHQHIKLDIFVFLLTVIHKIIKLSFTKILHPTTLVKEDNKYTTSTSIKLDSTNTKKRNMRLERKKFHV